MILIKIIFINDNSRIVLVNENVVEFFIIIILFSYDYIVYEFMYQNEVYLKRRDWYLYGRLFYF